ncbi:hypothetical protein CQW23_35579 [Capsicum baccatum]|uniref:Uncharacterized protein n=1 Tax=Capsicum baccatum TaxID=33114 RepID=A0A2G2UVM7_CAPBA|nr:hypothetical protein CQW23_35579 [Capsicum baccatum]
MDIIGLTTVMHLGNSDEVPTNGDLITDVPPLNAKLSNKYANKRSHMPPAVYGGKTPTKTTYVSKRLSKDKSESSSRDYCWKRVKVHFDDAKGISLPRVEIHDDIDNPFRTISALVKEVEELLHDFFDLVTSYKQARSMLHDMNEEITREELLYVAGKRLTYAMLEENEKVKASSSIRQSLQNIKKKIKEFCIKAQALECLLEKSKNIAKKAKLESSIVAKEFDASFDADLSNGVDPKKERLEDMHQDLINYKLCLD